MADRNRDEQNQADGADRDRNENRQGEQDDVAEDRNLSGSSTWLTLPDEQPRGDAKDQEPGDRQSNR